MPEACHAQTGTITIPIMGSVLYTKRSKVTDTTLPATEIKDLLLF